MTLENGSEACECCKKDVQDIEGAVHVITVNDKKYWYCWKCFPRFEFERDIRLKSFINKTYCNVYLKTVSDFICTKCDKGSKISDGCRMILINNDSMALLFCSQCYQVYENIYEKFIAEFNNCYDESDPRKFII